MNFKNFSAIGMSEKEGKAYLAILELGEATMSDIVKKSHLKRTTLYDIIEILREKGLIGLSKYKKRITYVAENPAKLLECLEEEKQAIQRVMPELLTITNSMLKKPKVRFYEGRDGIKDVYRDILRYPIEKIQAWVPENIIYELDKKFFEEHYTPKLRAQKMVIELIATDLPEFRRHKEDNTVPTRKIKLVDSKRFPFSVEITLYGRNRLAIMSYQDQMGLIIESEQITKTLRSIFTLQWSQLSDEERVSQNNQKLPQGES